MARNRRSTRRRRREPLRRGLSTVSPERVKAKEADERPEGLVGSERVVIAGEPVLTYLRRDLAVGAGLGLALPLIVVGLAVFLK